LGVAVNSVQRAGLYAGVKIKTIYMNNESLKISKPMAENPLLSDVISDSVRKSIKGLEANTDIKIVLTKVVVDVTDINPPQFTVNLEWYEC
jgi:hypothetical protein